MMANLEVVHEENGDLVCYARNAPSYEEITIEDEDNDADILKLRIHSNTEEQQDNDTEILKLRIHSNTEEQQHFNLYLQNLDCGTQPQGFVPVALVTEPFLPQSIQLATPVTPHHSEEQTTVEPEATFTPSQQESADEKKDNNQNVDEKDTNNQNVDEKDTKKQNGDENNVMKQNGVENKDITNQKDNEKIVRKGKEENIFVKGNNRKKVKHFETKGLEKLLKMKKEIKVEVVDEQEEQNLEIASIQDKSLGEETNNLTHGITSPRTPDATMKFRGRKLFKKGFSPLSKSSPEPVVKEEIISDDDTKSEVITSKLTPSLVKIYNAQLPVIKIEKMDLEKVKKSLIFHEKNAAAAAAKASKKKVLKSPIKKPKISSKNQTKRVVKSKTKVEDIENTSEYFFEKTIPQGWKRIVRQRKVGVSAGKYDVYVYSPSGKKLRSRVEVGKYLEDNNITDLNKDDFEFGVKSQKFKLTKIQPEKVKKQKLMPTGKTKLENATKKQPEKAKKLKLMPTGKSKLETAYCPIDYNNPIPSTSGIKFPKAKQRVATSLQKDKYLIDYDNPVPSTSGINLKIKKKSCVDSEPVKKKRKVEWKVKFQPSTKILSEHDDLYSARKRVKSKSKTPSPKQNDYSYVLQRYKKLLRGQSVTINLVKCDFPNHCQDHMKRLKADLLPKKFRASKSLKMLATLQSLEKLPGTCHSKEELQTLSPMSTSPTENLLFFEQDVPCCEPSSDILRSLELIRCPPSLSDAVKLCEVESQGSSSSVHNDSTHNSGHPLDSTNVSNECDGLWVPPKSPFNIIYESLYSEPWKLLIATIIMRNCAAPVGTTLVWHFFEKYSTFESLQKTNPADIEKLLQHSSNPQKCAKKIVKFAEEFNAKPWMYPYELSSIGKYGGDAYRIFCVKEWRDVHPNDFDLCIYHNWLSQNHQKLNV